MHIKKLDTSVDPEWLSVDPDPDPQNLMNPDPGQ